MRSPDFTDLPSRSFLLGVFGIAFSFLIYGLILSNAFSLWLRPLSLLARTGYTLTAPALFLLFHGLFRLRKRWGQALSFFLTLSVFGLALAGGWAAGITESGILSGVIPMFDSASYFVFDASSVIVVEGP